MVDSRGAIRVVVYPSEYPGETTGTAKRADELDAEVRAKGPYTWIGTWFTKVEAAEERHLVDVLAQNLRRLMDRKGITPDVLAQLAGIDPERLAEILEKRTPAAYLDEVCNLAECLGTTADALLFLFRPKDYKAGGWN